MQIHKKALHRSTQCLSFAQFILVPILRARIHNLTSCFPSLFTGRYSKRVDELKELHRLNVLIIHSAFKCFEVIYMGYENMTLIDISICPFEHCKSSIYTLVEVPSTCASVTISSCWGSVWGVISNVRECALIPLGRVVARITFTHAFIPSHIQPVSVCISDVCVYIILFSSYWHWFVCFVSWFVLFSECILAQNWLWNWLLGFAIMTSM